MMASSQCNFIKFFGILTISFLYIQRIFEIGIEKLNINPKYICYHYILINYKSINLSNLILSKLSYNYFHIFQIFVISQKILAYNLISIF